MSNRKPRRNIPNEKLTLLLQYGGPLTSTAGAKNLNGILRPTSPTNGKQQAVLISPPVPTGVFHSKCGRKGKSRGKNGYWANDAGNTTWMPQGVGDEGGEGTGPEDATP
jgi:hypothetical protein